MKFIKFRTRIIDKLYRGGVEMCILLIRVQWSRRQDR